MVDNIDALRARDDLLAVAASWPALRARLRPTGGSSEIRTPPESKPPIAVAVSDTMRQIEDRTRFYAGVLVDEVAPEHGCHGACHGASEHRCGGHLCATAGETTVLPEQCPTRRDPVTTSIMPGLLEEVAARYGHFLTVERLALDFLDDAHEMRRLVTGTLAANEPARFQGVCPEVECGGEIYQRSGATDARCRDCGRTVGPVEWRALMFDAFETRLMSLEEIRAALVVTDHKVPIETLKTWAKRGANHGDPNRGLVPVYVDPTLYRFSDAYHLAERRAERKAS